MPSITLSVTSGARDTDEDSIGTNRPTASPNIVGYVGTNNPYYFGVIFRPTTGDLSDLNGVTIDSASIDFKSQSNDSGTFSGTMYGLDEQSPADFTSAGSHLSGRTRTSVSETWDGTSWGNWTSVGTANFDTPPAIIRDLQTSYASSWTGTDGIGFVWAPVTGSGERIPKSYDGGSGNAAVLTIDYTAGGAVTTSPAPVVATFSVPAVTVSLSAALTSPTALVATFSVPVATVSLGAGTTAPVPVVAAFSVPSETINLGAGSTSPATVAATFAVPVVTVDTPAGVVQTSPAPVAATFAVPSVTVTLGTVATSPSPVVVAITTPAVTVSMGASITTITGLEVFLNRMRLIPGITPIVTLGAATTSPDPVAATFVIVVPTLTFGGGSTAPNPVTATFVIPTVTVQTIVVDPDILYYNVQVGKAPTTIGHIQKTFDRDVKIKRTFAVIAER